MSAQNRGSQGLDDSWSTPLSRPAETTPKVTTVFPKQVFHGLASLLIISLCALLVELNSPGIASRITNRLNFWKNPQATVAINTKTANNYYHPVPSPFVAPKATSFVEDFLTPAVASEPGIGEQMIGDGPKEEPTIFDINIFPQTQGSEPTNEPTASIKSKKAPTSEERSTGEPTTFVGFTGEPTIFGNTGEPTVYGHTGEPTVYGQSEEPTVYGQSGEPTIYGQTGEPTLYGNGRGSGGGAETSEPTIFVHDTLGSGGSEPTNEPTVFFKDDSEGNGGSEHESNHHHHHHENQQRTDSGTSSSNSNDAGSRGANPTQAPHIHTFAPTMEGSFAPTSDPTIFPTPEPTNSI